MAARVTEAVQSKMTTLPAYAGPRAAAAERARTAFFSSLSRELRWSLDHEERFLVLEGAWQSVLGWRPERLHGWHWEEVVHPGDRTRVTETLDRLRAGGGAERDIEVRLARATGGYHLMQWTIVSGSGADLFLGLGTDRAEEPAGSELAQRNAELAARVAELEERYTTVERFAGTAAHQLAEPLVIAESSAILVADELGEDLDPMLRGRLDAIGRGAARARRLMDALLADARSTGGLQMRSVDVAAVVEETLTILESQIEERDASVVTGPLPHVLADPGLLAVVLENLLSNALKYGPRSDATITVTAERILDRWRVSVAGEGTPIAADQAERIFNPFHRVPGERRIPGVGLGLTICARLMERLGGAIGVEPGAESGNSFWIELPAG
jgi:PAS domain S-box-containing protein